MEPIEVTGKKIGDALKEGLRLLGTTIDKVEYKVISPGGLFKKAKISIKLIEDETAAPKKSEPQKPDRVQKEERPLRSERPERAERTERAERQERVERSERAERQERAEKTERASSKPQREQRVNSAASVEGGKGANQRNQGEARRTQQANSQSQRFNSERQNRGRDQKGYANSRPQIEKKPEYKKRVRTEEVTEADVERAVTFVRELLRHMGHDIEINSTIEDGDIIIDLVNETGALIGYRGETLDAIEYLTSININKEVDEYINVVIDSCGYRKKREKMLVAMAENAAKRCIRQGRKVIMEPMNRSSRKVVHSTLASYDNIFTKSEGSEPNRHIVLFFKRDKH